MSSTALTEVIDAVQRLTGLRYVPDSLSEELTFFKCGCVVLFKRLQTEVDGQTPETSWPPELEGASAEAARPRPGETHMEFTRRICGDPGKGVTVGSLSGPPHFSAYGLPEDSSRADNSNVVAQPKADDSPRSCELGSVDLSVLALGLSIIAILLAALAALLLCVR